MPRSFMMNLFATRLLLSEISNAFLRFGSSSEKSCFRRRILHRNVVVSAASADNLAAYSKYKDRTAYVSMAKRLCVRST